MNLGFNSFLDTDVPKDTNEKNLEFMGLSLGPWFLRSIPIRVFSKVLVEIDEFIEFIENASWLCEYCYLW